MDFKDIIDITELDEFKNLPDDKKAEYLNSMVRDMMDEIEDAQNRYMKHRKKMTLAEILFYTLSGEDLKDLCREKGFKGFSKFRVRELAAFVAEKLLDEAYLRKFLLYLRDADLELLEEFMENDNYTFLGFDDEYYLDLLAGCYIAVDYDGNAELASDFNAVYKKIMADGFEEERKKVHWAMAVMLWIQNMYTSAPKEMYNDLFRLEYDFSDEQIGRLVEEIPEEQKLCIFIDDKIVARGAAENKIYVEVEKNQGDSPFYIPDSPDEIWDLYSNLYLSRELKYVNLINWLVEYQEFNKEAAEDVAREIWSELNFCANIEEVEAILEDYDIVFDSEAELDSFMSMFVEAYANTRTLQLRGHKVIELFPEAIEELNEFRMFEPGGMEQFEQMEESKVISIDEWKKNMN